MTDCVTTSRGRQGEEYVSERLISLRGVEVHNLQGVDLDLPHRRLIVFCGVSGSGKSSLAFDTIYAEGQRRYIESFSAYTRQFLERLEKPAAQRIDGISPAIAVAASNHSRSSRATVGTSTEAYDYLRLLLARVGRVFCRQCGREVVRQTPQSVAAELLSLPSGTRYMVAFPWPHPASVAAADLAVSANRRGRLRPRNCRRSNVRASESGRAQAAAARKQRRFLPLFAESADEAATDVEADTQEQESEESEPKEMLRSARLPACHHRSAHGGRAADERLRQPGDRFREGARSGRAI